MSENATQVVPNADWLRDFAEGGGLLDRAGTLLVADILEMLGNPDTRLLGAPTRYAYPEYRVKALLNRMVRTFARLGLVLDEDKDGASA